VVINVSLPILARLQAESDHGRLKTVTHYLAITQFIGVSIAALPLIAFPETLIDLAFGASFRSAASAMIILIIGHLIGASLGVAAPLLVIMNREGRVTRAMGIGLATTVVSVSALTPYFGLEGAAFGLSLGLVCWNVLCWRDAKTIALINTSIFQRG
jgi:O-antigen/teichoic acid export membrane protein